MQLQQEAYYNFVNSIDSESTKKIYEYCMSKFLKYYDIDLDSLLELPQQGISNLIIKYLVDKKISRQYKNIILATIKHACEMNDAVLNWMKLKKFIKSLKSLFNEAQDYDKIIEKANRDKIDYEYRIYVILFHLMNLVKNY